MIIGNGGIIAPSTPAVRQDEQPPAPPIEGTVEANDDNAVSIPNQVGTALVSEIHLPIRFGFACTAITQAHSEGKTPREIAALVQEFYQRVFAEMEKTTSFHLLRDVFYQVFNDAYQDLKAQDDSGLSQVKLFVRLDHVGFPKVEPQAGSYYVMNQSRVIDPPKNPALYLSDQSADQAGTSTDSSGSNTDGSTSENPQTAEQLTADGGDAESSTPGDGVVATAPSEGTTSAPEAVN